MNRTSRSLLVESLVAVGIGLLTLAVVAVITLAVGDRRDDEASVATTTSTEPPPSTERQSSPRGSTATAVTPTVTLQADQPATVEGLRGIWLNDGGPGGFPGLLVRFGPERTIAFDPLGRLDVNPAVVGTFDLSADAVNIAVGAGSWGCPVGDTFSWRARLSSEGRMVVETIEDGTGNCSAGVGNVGRWTRVSPASPAGAAIAATAPGRRPVPPSSNLGLEGIWLLEGSGRLLRLTVDGGYAIDDAGTLGVAPTDTGTFILDGSTLTLTSGQSATCPVGGTQQWTELQLFGDTLRAVVQDGCADGVPTPQTWIRLSPP